MEAYNDFRYEDYLKSEGVDFDENVDEAHGLDKIVYVTIALLAVVSAAVVYITFL